MRARGSARTYVHDSRVSRPGGGVVGGDVDAGGGEEQDPAGAVGHRRDDQVDGALAAVGDEVGRLAAEGPAGGGLAAGLADRRLQRGRGALPAALSERAADRVLAGVAAGLEAEAVGLDDGAVEREDAGELGRLVEQGPELGVGGGGLAELDLGPLAVGDVAVVDGEAAGGDRVDADVESITRSARGPTSAQISVRTALAGRPSAHGCLAPRVIRAYASLSKNVRSGPQPSHIA